MLSKACRAERLRLDSRLSQAPFASRGADAAPRGAVLAADGLLCACCFFARPGLRLFLDVRRALSPWNLALKPVFSMPGHAARVGRCIGSVRALYWLRRSTSSQHSASVIPVVPHHCASSARVHAQGLPTPLPPAPLHTPADSLPPTGTQRWTSVDAGDLLPEASSSSRYPLHCWPVA